MTASLFSTLFLAALLLSTSIKIWLAQRQMRHVSTHRNEVPDAFRSQVDLAAHQKAADYTCAKTRLGIVSAIIEALILLALTLGGGLQIITDVSQHAFSNPLLHGMAMIVSVVLLTSILEIPFGLYSTFVIEERFGFNKMTLKLYLLDAVKGLLIGSLLGLPLLLGILWLMERMGDNWWLYVWAAWVCFSLLLLFIYPSFIAPIFNKFKPLEDESLKARIEALLHRCGFKAQGLFVMDGSKRSSHGNAYFTGFGKTKRIVFFDTLISRLTANEIDAVLAHELGHFKRRHVLKRIALTFAVSLAFLWLLSQLMHADWFYTGLGVNTHSTAIALLLFFMVLPAFTFLLQPVGSAYSRKHEFEADAYAVKQTAAADLVTALVKLYQDNASTLTPDPLYSAFYSSHPPAMIRISRLQSL
jgi:STE24 endopeptidase